LKEKLSLIEEKCKKPFDEKKESNRLTYKKSANEKRNTFKEFIGLNNLMGKLEIEINS